MPLNAIITIISVLLVASVIGSIIYTKKEEAAAARRLLVTNLRYKADEALAFYENLQTVGLEKIIYYFLLDRIIYNLTEAYNLDPSTPGIKLKLSAAQGTMNSFDSLTFSAQIPSDEYELKALISKLTKFIMYVDILVQKHVHNEKYYKIKEPSVQQVLPDLVPSIQYSILKFDVEGHLKLGLRAADRERPGTAKQSYLHAKQSLLSSGIDDAYVQEHLEKIDELLKLVESQLDLTTKNEVLEKEPQPDSPEIDESSDSIDDDKVVISDYEMATKKAVEEAISSQEELNKKNKKEDIFNRKPW